MRRSLLIGLPLLLAGCGLSPVYADGRRGSVALLLGAVAVDPIPDRAGFLVRDRLLARLGAGDGGPPRYRLVVRLDDRIEGFGVRGDNSIIRERRTLRARWQLYAEGAQTPLLDATSGADAGIDVVGSEYATVAAETSALERLADSIAADIVARVALFARAQAAAPAGPALRPQSPAQPPPPALPR